MRYNYESSITLLIFRASLLTDPTQISNMDELFGLTTLHQDESKFTFDEVLLVTSSPSDFLNYDRIVMTIYLISVLIPSTALNASVIYLTKKYHQFHIPYMYVKSTCALLDIMIVWGLIPHYIIHDHFGKSISSRFVCYSSDFGLALFLSTAQFTAVVAIERYLYFCKPFVYQRWVTLKSVVSLTVVLISFSQIYIFATEIMYGRELEPLVALCQLKDQAFHSTFQFVVYFVPSIVATIFSIHHITKLIKNVDVGPAQGTTNMESVARKRAAKGGVR